MRIFLLFVLTLPGVAADLFRDDFSRFAPGLLSAPIGQLNGAIQEYHYIEHRGVRTFPWRNPIVHHDGWAAGDEDGKPYLEQHLVNAEPRRFVPLFVTGDPDWRDYTVEASVRPLSFAEHAGIVFRYHTSRHYYLFALDGGKQARVALRLPIEQNLRVVDYRVLGSVDFAYDPTRYYRLKVECDGPKIRAYIDGKLVIEAEDRGLEKGIAGLVANVPARFQDFHVSATAAAAEATRARIAAREKELAQLRSANPKPVLWKKFDTAEWGAGRNVRFGDLDGDGRIDMLFAQNVPKVRGDAFDHISCLTAVTLDGKVLWQQGRPNPKNGLLTNDTPFQIHDIDGDGRNEVVLARDFQLQVLDGATGKLKNKTWLPKMDADLKERPYEYHIGDSIAFLNAGEKTARNILVKDRYRNFWIYDSDLKLLWKGEAQTGHYPYMFDTDGDGKQEFQIGYSLYTSAGRRLWSHDTLLKDHPDGISIGNFSGEPNGGIRTYVCGSDEGFLVFGIDGNIVKQVRLGHAQTQAVGKFVPSAKGLQIMIANFWRSPGIVTLFDHDGNILRQEELVPGSAHLTPVNWRGDGQEFALLSGNIREGGMIDGELRRVVMFPDDGHPDLAYHVANVTGDARDEIILWDQSRVWIYTQDTPFKGKRIYKPVRNPDYNDSNYRASVSLPGWE